MTVDFRYSTSLLSLMGSLLMVALSILVIKLPASLYNKALCLGFHNSPVLSSPYSLTIVILMASQYEWSENNCYDLLHEQPMILGSISV